MTKMRCYVDNVPCSCEMDTIAEQGCEKDTPVEPVDPFRAGELGLDDHLVYLNGLSCTHNP